MQFGDCGADARSHGKAVRRSPRERLTASFGLNEHLEVNERLELAARIGAAVLLIAGACLGEGRAVAQTTSSASPAVLWTGQKESAPETPRSEVGLVQVEVVVTDHRHIPVTGLPEDAFRLEEDGRPSPLIGISRSRPWPLPRLCISGTAGRPPSTHSGRPSAREGARVPCSPTTGAHGAFPLHV